MSECIPKKRIIIDNRPPWISDDIMKAIRRRNRLFAAYKKSGNEGCALPNLLQQFSLGTRPHKSRTHSYVSTSAENGLAMAGPVPAPMI